MPVISSINLLNVISFDQYEMDIGTILAISGSGTGTATSYVLVILISIAQHGIRYI